MQNPQEGQSARRTDLIIFENILDFLFSQYIESSDMFTLHVHNLLFLFDIPQA